MPDNEAYDDHRCANPGCGKSLAGRRAGTLYCDSTCRARASDARKALRAAQGTRAPWATGRRPQALRNAQRPQHVHVRLSVAEYAALHALVHAFRHAVAPLSGPERAAVDRLEEGWQRWWRRHG